MDRNDRNDRPPDQTDPPHGVSCLAPDCPCRDPRIVSRRRAGFFAYLARERGETATRVVRPDASWRLPAAS